LYKFDTEKLVSETRFEKAGVFLLPIVGDKDFFNI